MENIAGRDQTQRSSLFREDHVQVSRVLTRCVSLLGLLEQSTTNCGFYAERLEVQNESVSKVGSF